MGFDGTEVEKVVFESCHHGLYIHTGVVELWARHLNEEEKKRDKANPLRLFCNPNTLVCNLNIQMNIT
jgi:hypothetical protein